VRPRIEAATLLAPGVALLLVAFVLPVAQLLSVSVVDANGEFSLAAYGKLFVDTFYLGVTARTLRLAVIITIVTLVLGYPIAYIAARASPRVALWMSLLVIIPLLTSVVIRTFGWLVVLGRNGLLAQMLEPIGLVAPGFALMRTEAGVVIALAQVLLPFMVLTLIGAIRAVDPRYEEAARTMGAGFGATLARVTIPLSMPGIVAGSLLVFALAISSFVTPALVGGPRLPFLAGGIFEAATATLDWPLAAAQSTLLLVAVMLLFIPATFMQHRRHG
jgi:putative spermidine/putrescine transport system permease protein